MNWLLNNPVVFTLIVVAIVLIAVGLILYFLVFKTKVEAKCAARKKRKEEKRSSDAKSKELVSDVFKEREKAEEPAVDDKQLEETIKKLSTDSRKQTTKVTKSDQPKPAPKKTEGKDVNNISDVISTMDQFRKK